MSDTFNAGDIIDKTLLAVVRVPVYSDTIETAKPYGYVEAGQPVGVVYSYLAPNPDAGRSILWWQFRTTMGAWYYAPQKAGLYSVSALKEQGVLTEQEKTDLEKEKEENANMTWYEKLLKDYWKPVAGVVVLSAAVKGYFSRPAK